MQSGTYTHTHVHKYVHSNKIVMREGEGGGKAMLLMLRGTLSLLPHTQCVAAVNEPSVCSKYDAR